MKISSKCRMIQYQYQKPKQNQDQNCNLNNIIDPVAKDSYRYTVNFVLNSSLIVTDLFYNKYLAEIASFGFVKHLSDNGTEFMSRESVTI